MTSLPAPVSPKKATVTSVCANLFKVSNTSSIGADRAASRPKFRIGSGARRRTGAGTCSLGGAQLPRPVPWLAARCVVSRALSSLATAPAGIFRLGRSLSAVFATSIFRRLPSRKARSQASSKWLPSTRSGSDPMLLLRNTLAASVRRGASKRRRWPPRSSQISRSPHTECPGCAASKLPRHAARFRGVQIREPFRDARAAGGTRPVKTYRL